MPNKLADLEALFTDLNKELAELDIAEVPTETRICLHSVQVQRALVRAPSKFWQRERRRAAEMKTAPCGAVCRVW